MINLIIDAANEKIVFVIITDKQSYTSRYINSRENFDKFNDLLLIFLKKYKIEFSDIEKIFINQGPGKLSSIRTSISISKAIALSKNITLIGFCSNDLIDKDYKKLVELESKNLLNKDLIKPLYSS